MSVLYAILQGLGAFGMLVGAVIIIAFPVAAVIELIRDRDKKDE